MNHYYIILDSKGHPIDDEKCWTSHSEAEDYLIDYLHPTSVPLTDAEIEALRVGYTIKRVRQ